MTASSPISTPLSRIEWPPMKLLRPMTTGAVRVPGFPGRPLSDAFTEWKSVS
jgi:hypothetical protein